MNSATHSAIRPSSTAPVKTRRKKTQARVINYDFDRVEQLKREIFGQQSPVESDTEEPRANQGRFLVKGFNVTDEPDALVILEQAKARIASGLTEVQPEPKSRYSVRTAAK